MSEQATQLQLLMGQAFELENELAAMLQDGGDGTVSANAGGTVTASTGMDDRHFFTKLVDPFGLVFKKKDKKINLDPFKHIKALHRKIWKKDKKDGLGAFPVIGALGTQGGVVASGDQQAAAAAPALNPFAWMQPAAAAGETNRAGVLGLGSDVAAAAPAPVCRQWEWMKPSSE
jgi:hypothetical protein